MALGIQGDGPNGAGPAGNVSSLHLKMKCSERACAEASITIVNVKMVKKKYVAVLFSQTSADRGEHREPVKRGFTEDNNTRGQPYCKASRISCANSTKAVSSPVEG